MIYDYVVVGAGSSGAPLASRLSEDPDVQVLLIEAGPDFADSETPEVMFSPNTFLLHAAAGFEAYRWPAVLARQAEGRELEPYTRGRGAGGSSSVNAQLAIRGLMDDYDEWARQGATGWAGADVLPYFIRLEDDVDVGDAPYHGRGGPIPISRAPLEQWGPVGTALREAAVDLGYGWHDDHNAPGSSGASPFALNLRDGRRVSTNTGYLEVGRTRPNLTIMGDALVERVEFEGARATAVRVRTGGASRVIAAREVLLAAGAIHSPAILHRSGVGPAQDLAELGVDVRRDLPVGRGLLDHAGVSLELRLVEGARRRSDDTTPINCILRYTSGLVDAGENDMAVIALDQGGLGPEGRATGHLTVSPYRTFSRGRLHFTSASPDAQPEVDFRLLSDERDLVRIRDGVQRILELCRHAAFERTAESIAEPADDDLDAWLLANVNDGGHAAGTCRMGRADDPRTVVDADCRVLGLEGLRVIDASIMPEIPRANTHLTCVMIGELMADRLKRERAAG